MKTYRPRIYYTEADKAMMWERWAKGESLNSIARLFDRHHPSIRRILAARGAWTAGAWGRIVAADAMSGGG